MWAHVFNAHTGSCVLWGETHTEDKSQLYASGGPYYFSSSYACSWRTGAWNKITGKATRNSARLKPSKEILKLLFLDKLLPQAEIIFYLEGVKRILNLLADTSSFGDGLGIPLIMYVGLRMLYATLKVKPGSVRETLPLSMVRTRRQ